MFRYPYINACLYGIGSTSSHICSHRFSSCANASFKIILSMHTLCEEFLYLMNKLFVFIIKISTIRNERVCTVNIIYTPIFSYFGKRVANINRTLAIGPVSNERSGRGIREFLNVLTYFGNNNGF